MDLNDWSSKSLYDVVYTNEYQENTKNNFKKEGTESIADLVDT